MAEAQGGFGDMQHDDSAAREVARLREERCCPMPTERERIARLLWNASEDWSSDDVKCAWEPMAPTEEGRRFLAMADALLADRAGVSQEPLSVVDLARVIRDEAKRHPPTTDLEDGCRAIAAAVLDWLRALPSPERTRYVLAHAGWGETIRQLETATDRVQALEEAVRRVLGTMNHRAFIEKGHGIEHEAAITALRAALLASPGAGT